MTGIADYFKHMSVSNINGFISWRSRWYMERIALIKSVMGPEAHRGSAVEHGVALGLIHNAEPDACAQLALKDYDDLCADLDLDATAACRESIPDLTKTLLATLKPFGKVLSVQREVRGEFPQLPGIQWLGFIDFEFEHFIVDLKTKKQTPSTIPSDWGRQGAFYRNRLGKPVKFICGVPLKRGVNVVEFEVNGVNGDGYLNQLVEAALSMDRILALPKASLADIFMPDPDDWFLRDKLTLNHAKTIWPSLAA